MAKLFGWYITRQEPVGKAVTKYLPNVAVVEAVVGRCWPDDGERFYYHGCEQALAELPGAQISKVSVVEWEGKYFTTPYGLIEIVIQPKPKKAKGA